MHLRLPWAFHFHETVGVLPSPWSCVSLLIHSRFPSSSITICTHVDEQQGLVVQVQDKTYRSPACQEVADKPSYSKWSWQVGLQSHLELGVRVVNLLSLLLLSFWCGCAIQGALQFSWNFQPSATNCRRRQGFAFLTRADNLLSSLCCESPFGAPVTADPPSVQLGIQDLISAKSWWRCYQWPIFPDTERSAGLPQLSLLTALPPPTPPFCRQCHHLCLC